MGVGDIGGTVYKDGKGAIRMKWIRIGVGVADINESGWCIWIEIVGKDGDGGYGKFLEKEHWVQREGKV